MKKIAYLPQERDIKSKHLAFHIKQYQLKHPSSGMEMAYSDPIKGEIRAHSKSVKGLFSKGYVVADKSISALGTEKKTLE